MLGLAPAVACLAISLVVSARAAEVDLLYTGPPDSSAWQGLQLGVDESNRQGEFLGVTLNLSRTAGNSVPPTAIAVFAAGPLDVRAVAAAAGDRAVFNLSDSSDALRDACLANALHVVPSERMKSDAVQQWLRRDPGGQVSAAAWHGRAVKFAARDLNKRFLARFGVPMDDEAWAGWFAARAVGDTLMREPDADAESLLRLLKEADGLDGQKGDPHSFRASGQLRQPLVLVAPTVVFWAKHRCAAWRAIWTAWELPPASRPMIRNIPATLILLLSALPALAEPTYRLFVTNEAGDSVTVIDSRTGEVEKTVAVGGRPRGIGFSPDRKAVYVALGDENAIGVLNVATLEIERKISAGSDPEAFAVHPNGTIYLSNEDDGLATALDPSTGEILAEIKVGLEPEGVGISPGWRAGSGHQRVIEHGPRDFRGREEDRGERAGRCPTARGRLQPGR